MYWKEVISLISGILLVELRKTTRYLKTAGLLIKILNLGPSKQRNVTYLTTTLFASVELGVSASVYFWTSLLPFLTNDTKLHV
jgi:hypothetical protein